MEQHMKNLIPGFRAIAVLVVGGFVGAQNIDSNQRIYAKVGNASKYLKTNNK
jgi:hypothetical protein